MAASIFVVVVLPLVPVTTTIPPRTPASAWVRNAGSIRSATSPGIADPPPPRMRAAARAALPATIAAVVLSTRQPYGLRGATPADAAGYAPRVSSSPATPSSEPAASS